LNAGQDEKQERWDGNSKAGNARNRPRRPPELTRKDRQKDGDYS
jgi:hypothetical protein